jgi:SOS response regulatory protein OraA/RecX
MMKKVEESSQKSAYLYAIKLLAKRDYSIYKLSKKLKERGYDKEHLEDAIQEVIDLGYLKEEFYIEARIKGFMHKGLHPNFIQMKLKEEFLQVEVDHIFDIFSQYPMTICEQLERLIVKKLPRNTRYSELCFEEKQKIKQRAFRYAISKGHQYSKIQEIFQEVTTSDQ